MLHYTVALLILYLLQLVKGNSTEPKTNDELVDYLLAKHYIKSEEVANAMRRVDRGQYLYEYQYEDAPQPIGYGVNMSAPREHAFVLELLKDHLKKGNKALDIGSGSGYLTVAMGAMVGETGLSVGIDHIHDHVHNAMIGLIGSYHELFENKSVLFFETDGRLGYPEKAPYDVIHVGAAALEIPKPLLEQLKVGGRMLIPIGEPDEPQQLKIIDKLGNNSISERVLCSVLYSPLTDKDKMSDEPLNNTAIMKIDKLMREVCQ